MTFSIAIFFLPWGNSMTAAALEVDGQRVGPEPPGLLVDAEWLEGHLHDQRLTVVDLRDEEEYAVGHVPGAVRLDLKDLGGNLDGCDNVLLPPSDFERLMGQLGISNEHTVVAYDDHWGLPSARLVWAIHYYGGGPASVLNGGWDRWQEEGRPETSGPGPDGAATERKKRADRFEAKPRPGVVANYEWIAEGLTQGDRTLLDTRSSTEFAQGHLPGAISWDWFNAVPAGSWECSRDPSELRSELAALGVHQADEIVTYCRSGMRAAHTYVVLRYAGFPRVRLYDGSWQDWSRRVTPEREG